MKGERLADFVDAVGCGVLLLLGLKNKFEDVECVLIVKAYYR